MEKSNKKIAQLSVKFFISIRKYLSFRIVLFSSVNRLITCNINPFSQLLWLLLIPVLSGCAVKAYVDPIDVPENQLPVITLKAPITALVPLFWIFPLNMLNWIADDWRETTNVNKLYLITEDKKKVNLDRFSNILVRPDLQNLHMENVSIVSSVPIGPESCLFSGQSCTTKEEKDGQSITTCDDNYACSTPVHVVKENKKCSLQFYAQSNKTYEAFIRNNTLMITNGIKESEQIAKCHSSTSEYDSTKSRNYSETSKTNNHDC